MSLIIRSLSYVHPDREKLFHELNLTVGKGEKAALVGLNGMGKSTLLQLIAGISLPTSGEIIRPESSWYVPQHLGQYDHLSIAEALKIDVKLNAMQAILNGSVDAGYFEDLDDDWEVEEKLEMALAKWGIGHFSAHRLMGTLSGGQKTKVFLAGIEVHQPGIILFDEPTNHLDTNSRGMLYDLITQHKATILAVSHDRTLLNLLNKTLVLSQTGIEVFGGNFDFYLEQRQEKVNALQAKLEEQAKTLKQSQQKARDMAEQRQKKEAKGKSEGLSNSLPRIVAGGLKSKAQQSTAKVLDAHHEKISDLAEHIRETRSQIQQYQQLHINIAASNLHHGKILIDANNINYSYNGNALWKALTFQVRSGDRLHIEGDNGVGKTTLLKIITGAVEPTEGQYMSPDFSYLYLDQDYTMIKPDLSLYEQVQKYNHDGLQEHELKSLLIYSQFSREMFDRKCIGLSGGEKMKLALCCLAISKQAPDMLILDEPTNNLDIQSLKILTSAVKNFNGTLLVISHDQHFIKEIGINSQISMIKNSLHS
ncbi:ATPase subunit of ABC transporter with duplicated ATPase domains [Pedobacter sp. W3I1]|uniref:ABC-F family ATP-binding cassette domain-containing protein n=1 Tax=Pedobacter sp. W3I1 TaxID=3042291 RepID=UPI0027802E06|nr:ATP-binding cassette domain-containing protein [Pedobacter sp. W3I1]MDQ0639908.1 ATPase subunit of ABC transporter with duplicated ATPase domains [Pedobacter sp. W3I1]